MPVTARRASALTIAIALLATMVAACSHAAASPGPASNRRLADCGGNPQTKPQVVVITCSNQAITVHDVNWSAWGGKVATGTGSAIVNVCAFQDCHTGAYGSYPVVVVASGAVACRGGVSGYGRIQYMFVGTSPFANLPPHMKVPAAFFGKPGVGPPIIARPCH